MERCDQFESEADATRLRDDPVERLPSFQLDQLVPVRPAADLVVVLYVPPEQPAVAEQPVGAGEAQGALFIETFAAAVGSASSSNGAYVSSSLLGRRFVQDAVLVDVGLGATRPEPRSELLLTLGR